MQVRFGQNLVDAGLVGAERATALQEQRDALKGRAFGDDMGFPAREPAMSSVVRDIRLWQVSPRGTAPEGASISKDASSPPIFGSGRARRPAPGFRLGPLARGQAGVPIASSLK